MKHQPRKKDEIYFLRNRRSDRGDDDLHAMIIIISDMCLPPSLYQKWVNAPRYKYNQSKTSYTENKNIYRYKGNFHNYFLPPSIKK